MKKFAVLFLSREDWDSPEVVFVEANDSEEAESVALDKLGFSEEELYDMTSTGEYNVMAKEIKI